MTKISTRRLLALGAGSMLLLGACGGTSDDGGAEVATLQDADSNAGAADAAVQGVEPSVDLDPDEAALEFSQCMRDEGIDFPDLTIDAEGNIELRAAFQTVDPATEGFREAREACNEVLQQVGFGGGRREAAESPEFQDALVAFSACVRDEGYDVGDLTLGGRGQGDGQNAEQNAGQNDGQATDGDDGDGDGDGDGQAQRGQRAEGFGNRGTRFAEGLDLDYEDPAVAETIDGCLVGFDEALADAGLEAGPGRG